MTTTPTTSTALAKTQSDALAGVTGSSRDPARITEMLERAAEVAHVLTPASSCPELPEGISIATSAVLVHPSELYAIPGGDKVGLAKSALDRIGMALGISWDPRESRRLDDGRTRHYAAFQAVGTYPLWDGSRATVSATKEIDLRDGSPAALAMSPKQLAGARLHILAMAESKAKNRAIRSLGVRPAYTQAEAQKPFLCARAVFTGQTSDPELRRDFALIQAKAFLGAHASLYGDGRRSAPQLPPARPAPPVGHVLDQEDDVPDGEIVDEPTPAPPAATPPASSSQGSEPSAPTRQTRAAVSGFAIPGGKNRNTPIESAPDHDLSYWAGRIETDIAEGKDDPRFRDKNAALARALRAEQGRRAGGDADEGASSGGKGDPDDDVPF